MAENIGKMGIVATLDAYSFTLGLLSSPKVASRRW
jgi:hypothetical protein